MHFREDYEAGLERQAEDEALQAMLRGMDFIPNKMGEAPSFSSKLLTQRQEGK